jgi:hypothetical protein
MKIRKMLLAALILALILGSLYAIFVLDFTQLVRINQVLGIEPTWYAFDEYLRHDLIGMSREDVYAQFDKIGIRVTAESTGGCEYTQLGNLLKITSYFFCYDRNGKLRSVTLSS